MKEIIWKPNLVLVWGARGLSQVNDWIWRLKATKDKKGSSQVEETACDKALYKEATWNIKALTECPLKLLPELGKGVEISA